MAKAVLTDAERLASFEYLNANGGLTYRQLGMYLYLIARKLDGRN